MLIPVTHPWYQTGDPARMKFWSEPNKKPGAALNRKVYPNETRLRAKSDQEK